MLLVERCDLAILKTIIIVIIVILDPASSCGSGWTHDNGNCYYASTDERSQSSALSRCQNRDSDLVSISDENELNFVKALLYV